MNRKFSLFTAAMVALAAAGPASGFTPGDKLLPGNNVKLKVTKAQIGITAPAGDDCPTNSTMGIWFHTNKEGPVTFMVVRKGQNVSAPITVNAVKGAGGVFLATYMQNLTIVSSINAEYRAIVADGNGTVSNWASISHEC